MTYLLARLFLCVTILSLNVQSQDLLSAFENAIGIPPKLKPSKLINERGVQDYLQRGLKIPSLLNFLTPKSKSTSEVSSNFEKTYRKRVAVIKKLGDTIHDGFNEFTRFLLLFVGTHSRSILSIKNISEIITLVKRVTVIASIGITLLKNTMVDAYNLFRTFTRKPNKVLKFAWSQVLKATPVLPHAVQNLITSTIDKFVKD